MKRLILILTILVLTKFQAISQIASNSSDSVTCIPNSQLTQAINLIEKGKVAQNELVLTKSKIVLLESRISTKDSIISKFQFKEKVWADVDATYKQSLKNCDNYMENSQKIFEKQRSIIRFNKWGKWLFLGLGVGAGIMIK